MTDSSLKNGYSPLVKVPRGTCKITLYQYTFPKDPNLSQVPPTIICKSIFKIENLGQTRSMFRFSVETLKNLKSSWWIEEKINK